jgi:hypothetical protein
MYIPVAVLLGVAIIWLLSQEWSISFDWPRIPRGIPTLSAVILGLLVTNDWFFGCRGILGHPGGFFHTIFKLVLGFLLVSFVASGLTAIRVSKSIIAVLLNTVWCVGLVTVVLRFMGACNLPYSAFR